MKKHSFVIVACGVDRDAADFEDRFFEAGCGDATISVQKGAILLDFDRQAPSFALALESAVADVETAGAEVVRVEPDHLVSLSEIAARAGLTRAAVSHYAKGERGQAFPRPVVRVTSENPLWDWVEVAQWLHDQGRLSGEELDRARCVRRTNQSIMARKAGVDAELGVHRRREPIDVAE